MLYDDDDYVDELEERWGQDVPEQIEAKSLEERIRMKIIKKSLQDPTRPA